jgi:penicillin-binding protein 1A
VADRFRQIFGKIRPVWEYTKQGFRFIRRKLHIHRPANPGWRYYGLVLLRNLGVATFLLFGYFFLVSINFLWLFGKSPSLDELEDPYLQQASELYTSDGKLLGRYYKENRSPVTYDQISPVLIEGLIATEDVRFRQHAGIDMRSLPSIVYYSLKGDNRGGSTITQQLAKNLYKTRKSSSKGLLGYIPVIGTIISKTKEWETAVKLEQRYTKEEIVTLYLNTVDFGANSYGIKTAAKTFFSTSPDSISIPESATLIGLLKAPTYYSPILNPKRSQTRRNTVMGQMLKANVITQAQYDRYTKEPLTLKYSVEQQYDGPATYFRGVLNNYLNEWCKKEGYDLYGDGLKIYTTIDSRLQKLAEEAVEERMRDLQSTFNIHWRGKNPWVDENDKEIPGYLEAAIKRTELYAYLRKKYRSDQAKIDSELNRKKRMTVFTWKGEKDTTFSSMDSISYYKRFLHAGFMVMDPFTASIKAWVGGINYKYFKFDHVRQAKRQPGSTFKPFMYAAAFENGWGPCDRITDMAVRIKYHDRKKNKDTVWAPHNADYVFTGQNMTLRHAMGRSINSVAAQLTEKIGWETVIDYAHRMGIKSPLDTVPSIALGPSDVSLYEMVGAYCTFMNNGVASDPLFITRIEDRNGKVIKRFAPKSHRAISEETAWLMMYMLKGTIEEPKGTVQNLWSFDLFRGNELAGKTGTSSNHSDGWFIGLSKDLIGGAWVGGEDRAVHFRTSALGEGAKTALPIYGIFMEKVYADKSLGITMGYFPKPRIKITKPYNCRTAAYPKSDSTSTAPDSTGAPPAAEGL